MFNDIKIYEMDELLPEENIRKLHFSRDKINEKLFKQTLLENRHNIKIQQQKYDKLFKPKYKCNICIPQHQHKEQIIKFTENNLKSFSLSPRSKNAIENLIPKYLRKKYKSMHDNNILEFKSVYSDIMLDFVIKMTFKMDCGCDWTIDSMPHFKYLGKTKLYHNYLKNRQTVAKLYPLHKLVMQIMLKSNILLSKLICDLQSYQFKDYIQLPKLKVTIFEDIEKVKFQLNHYLLEMEKLIFHLYTKRDFYGIPYSHKDYVLEVCSKTIVLRIAEMIMNTVNNMLEDLSNPDVFPQLQLELTGKYLTLSPTKIQIYEVFHSFVDEFIQISPDNIHLKLPRNLKMPVYCVQNSLPNNYQQISQAELEHVLNNAFKPIDEYISNLQDKFKVLHDVEIDNKDWSLEMLTDQIQQFNSILYEINGMTRNVYFPIYILNQQNAKESLQSQAQMLRKLFINKMTVFHYNYNINICNSFEALENQLLNEIPEETKELMDFGEYVLHTKIVFLEEFKEKISESMKTFILLMEMTILDEEHLALNMQTINWLSKIDDVFEEHDSKFEQKKFDLAERLKMEIFGLNHQTDNLFPKLQIMYEMNDGKNIFNYLEVMGTFLKEFNEMKEKVDWINNEESIMKFNLSKYPKIDELKQFFMPFYDLLHKCNQWQTYFDVWLDGPFENLDANEIDNKTSDFFVSFSKIWKTYKSKIKINIATNYPYTFVGSVDNPDPFKQPAPMSLCNQMLEDIKWFKNYIPLVHCFCNPTLLQHHWDEISKIAGFDLTPHEGTTLRKIINLNLMEKLTEYEIISISASKEHSLKELYHKMYHEWDNMNFVTMPFKDSNIEILTQVDDIQSVLGEQIIKVQTMRGSAFVKPIKDKVESFYEQLLTIERTIQEWTTA